LISDFNRKHHEHLYFEAYLTFLNNSTYLNRFTYNVNLYDKIKGKYLNEKNNKWNKFGIF
jgi:hypothetical protein